MKSFNLEKRIFWIGPFYNGLDKISKADSPAAQKWQLSLLDSVFSQTHFINVIGYSPKQLFPLGPLYLSSNFYLRPYFTSTLSYFNIPLVRSKSLKKSLIRCLFNSIENNILVTYNTSKWLEEAVIELKKIHNFKWICVVADHIAPISADGYIFLSWSYFNRFHRKSPKLHLDGAIYDSKKYIDYESINPQRKLNLLYSGSFSKWGGLELLLKSFLSVRDSNIELLITGKGNTKFYEKYIKLDSRIKFLNFLSDDDLQEVYKRADIFLNPRPSNISGNENNFPSKLFDYLAFNKPIISTMTPGLSPVYRDLLIILEDESADSLSNLLNKTIDDIRFSRFAYNEKDTTCLFSWEQQANRLLKFLSTI